MSHQQVQVHLIRTSIVKEHLGTPSLSNLLTLAKVNLSQLITNSATLGLLIIPRETLKALLTLAMLDLCLGHKMIMQMFTLTDNPPVTNRNLKGKGSASLADKVLEYYLKLTGQHLISLPGAVLALVLQQISHKITLMSKQLGSCLSFTYVGKTHLGSMSCLSVDASTIIM